jgi:hypothetical protein
MCDIADEDGDAERKGASAVVEGSDSETGGAETVALRCESPVEDWQVLQKMSTTPGVA